MAGTITGDMKDMNVNGITDIRCTGAPSLSSVRMLSITIRSLCIIVLYIMPRP